MLKLLHTADLHLDSPFDALGDTLAIRRRAEQRKLLGHILSLAEEQGAALLLLAGDLLDSDSAYAETSGLLLEVFAGTSLEIFIAPGNHDPCTRLSPWTRLKFPPNVHIFRKNAVECVELPSLNLRVFGAGFEQSFAPPLLRGVEVKKLPGVTDVMVLHGDLNSEASPYNPISEDDIAQSGMDYIALGHVHAGTGLKRAGRTHYAYSGCPEGRGFDECGEKTVIEAEVGPGVCRARALPVGGRQYEILNVDLTGAVDPAQKLRRSLPEDTAQDIYRILLTGECAAPLNLGALREMLSPLFFSLQLRDTTRPAEKLWARAGEDTLRGLFLTRMKRLYDGAENEIQREIVVSALRYGLAAIDNAEEPRT